MKRSLVACLLSMVTTSVFAEADGPDYWRVYDVAEDDVLNLRRHPDYRSDKIGEIPADAECVRNIACRGGLTLSEYSRLDESQKQRLLRQRPRWCRVEYAGVTGWVAGKYLRESACDRRQVRRGIGIDPYQHRYRVENDIVELQRGSNRLTIPGTTSVIITEIYGQPLLGDIDGDGRDDAVMILMQHTGGSGVFYYLSVALGNGVIVDSVFVGDRIKIGQVHLAEGEVRLDYVDRTQDQSMADKPTVQHSVRYVLENNRIIARPE